MTAGAPGWQRQSCEPRGQVHLRNDGALGSHQQCVSSDTPPTWLIKKSSFQTTQKALGASRLLRKRSFEIIYSRAMTFLCVLRILTKLEQRRNCSADFIRYDNPACRTIKHTFRLLSALLKLIFPIRLKKSQQQLFQETGYIHSKTVDTKI